ncbi:MAG: tRNA (guanine(46)-N(7))-methyltransferase TrmB [Bauldia sp.]
MDAVRLEVGFGGGEHLVAEALREPRVGFIGVEPFLNGIGKIVSAIHERGLDRIRLHDDDAGALLDWVPPASLSRVDVLYPDPWPKRRHWKRRFISERNLDRIARALRQGGELRIASDLPEYIEWCLARTAERSDFEWTAQRADDWRQPWLHWPGTRYEAKALREGRKPTYLVFRRT